MNSKYSSQTLKFAQNLRNFLQSIKSSYQQFIVNLQLINSGLISKKSFFQFLHCLNVDSINNFDPHKTFKQISNNQDDIKVSELKSLVYQGKKIFVSPQQIMIQQEKTRKRNIQIAIKGLKYLQKYLHSLHDPLNFFRQFDNNNDGKFNRKQFQQLLRGTGITQFSSRQVRNLTVQNLYRSFKKDQIRTQQFMRMFKLLDKPKKPQIINKQVPKQIPKKSPFQKKQNQQIKQPPKYQFKKQDNQNPLQNAFKKYPNAMPYFRDGNAPQVSDEAYLYKLQKYLKQNKTYIDNKNPLNAHGKYVPAKQIFKGPYQLFQMASSVLVRQKSRIGLARQIQPKDVIQGQIGDCYFLSSIASIISIYPQIIAQNFLFIKNPVNYYVVKLFIDGQWQFLQTDDSFPCNQRNQPHYAKYHSKQIWVMLLQKCWAKVFGSYNSIASGSSKQGFLALSGAPCQIIQPQNQKYINKDILMKQLESAIFNRYVATTSGNSFLQNLGKKGQTQYGLVSGHAYSILKIIDINEQKLIKLRNPWGKTTWTGKWSFQSNAWTKQLRNRYNYNKNPQDGSFYMNFKDFLAFFGQIVICQIDPSFFTSSFRVKTNQRKSAYVKIIVKRAGKYFISNYQQGKRKYVNPLQDSNYQYSNARIIVVKLKNNTMQYVGSKNTSKSQACTIQLQLTQGEYIISSKVQWKFWPQKQQIINIYGVNMVEFQMVDRKIAPKFKQQLIKSYVKMKKGSGKVKSYDKYGFNNANTQINFSIQTGIGFSLIANNGDKQFNVQQTLILKGIKIIKPHKLPLVFEMKKNSQKYYGFFVSAQGYEYQSSQKIKQK